MTLLSNLAKQNLSSIFNQRDREKRRAALRELWAADGVLWTADGTYVGYSAVERAAASVLRRYPEFDFSPSGEIDEIPDAARMHWRLARLVPLPRSPVWMSLWCRMAASWRCTGF